MAVHYGRDEPGAAETVASIRRAGGSAFAVGMTLGSDATDVEALLAQVDDGMRREVGRAGLDVLVNNAGVTTRSSIADSTRAEFDQVFSVNVRDLFFLTRAAVPRIRSGGRIVNVSSGVTRIAFPQTIAYSLTKGAVDTLTRTLAKELGPRGITVNGVAPGVVDTDMNAAWLRGNPDAEAFVIGATALGRLGRPEDIADVVAFLASDDARFVTGQTIDATGGALLG